jgi:hypothetical protein
MSEKTVKTIAFSGTKDGYPMWEFKIPAFLRELGCADVLTRKDMRAEVTDLDEQIRNHKAYSRIAMAMGMDDVVSSQIVKRAVSKVYPDGDAAVAWLALAERYAPKMAVDKQVLFEELQASKLDDVAKDPQVWIMELQQIQSKLGEMHEFVSDGLLMCYILGNLPVEYENVADNLANDSKKTVSSVTVSLKDKYERLKKSGKIGTNSETVLISHKKFSGDCRYCGKKGHKAADCYKKKDDDKHKIGGNKEKKGFKGTCHNCERPQ